MFSSISLTVRGQFDEIPIPSFEGKPIGYWLGHLSFRRIAPDGSETEHGFPEIYQTVAQADKHQKEVSALRARAPQAIREIGVNGLPYILRMLTYDGDSKTKLEFLLKNNDGIKRDDSAPVIRGTAVVAFECLRKSRDKIEPQLRALLDQKGMKDDVKGAVIGALRAIGAEVNN